MKLFPLIAGNVEVNSLEMKQAKIELIRNAQGVWNFSTAGNAPAATPAANSGSIAAAKQPAQSAPSEQKQFTLGELKITDSQIAITDYQKHQARAVYDHIDVSLKDYAPGSPFSIDATAHLPGSGSQTFRLTRRRRPRQQCRLPPLRLSRAPSSWIKSRFRPRRSS